MFKKGAWRGKLELWPGVCNDIILSPPPPIFFIFAQPIAGLTVEACASITPAAWAWLGVATDDGTADDRVLQSLSRLSVRNCYQVWPQRHWFFRTRCRFAQFVSVSSPAVPICAGDRRRPCRCARWTDRARRSESGTVCLADRRRGGCGRDVVGGTLAHRPRSLLLQGPHQRCHQKSRHPQYVAGAHVCLHSLGEGSLRGPLF